MPPRLTVSGMVMRPMTFSTQVVPTWFVQSIASGSNVSIGSPAALGAHAACNSYSPELAVVGRTRTTMSHEPRRDSMSVVRVNRSFCCMIVGFVVNAVRA